MVVEFGPSYYDRNGKLLDGVLTWAALFENEAYKRVAFTRFSHVNVSTVWLGLDHNWFGGVPLIFETMIFGGPHDQFMRRWPTEASALAGHDRIVAALRDGRNPEDA